MSFQDDPFDANDQGDVMDRIPDVSSTDLGQTRPNFVVAGFGLGLLSCFALLYVFRIDLYWAILRLWCFNPFSYPFLDLIYVGAQVECFQKGIDVYLTNPCDPLGRLHDYSPLWLRLAFLTVTKTWPNTAGLSIDILFMLSLLALPRSRPGFDTNIVVFCVISPMSVFALERGNVDVEMFILAVLAVVCLDRGPAARAMGYAVVLMASLLKFYPLTLFTLLYREKPKVGALIALAVVGAMGAFALIYRAELPAMAANIPQPSLFNDSFGAGQLPEGFGQLLQQLGRSLGSNGSDVTSQTNRGPFVIVYAILAGGVALTVSTLSRNAEFRRTLSALTSREELCLLVGSLLTCGCFFAGRSVGYREIDLLLAIPSLLALRRLAPPRLWPLRIASVIAVFLLWYPVPQRAVYLRFGGSPDNGGRLPTFLYWFGRELGWWSLIAILLATTVAVCLNNFESRRRGIPLRPALDRAP